MDDLIALSAVDAVLALRQGDVTPLELLAAAERRTVETEPRLRAMLTRCFDRAREQASKLRSGRPGRLTEHPAWLGGLPVTVKDIVDVAGLPTTFGCPALRDRVADSSSPLVRRLDQLGALIIGKTNLPEFCSGPDTANELAGRTVNPWDSSVSCGASSGGAAVSVASGAAWCAHGEDTAGSIRIPAAFCSVVGIRPSAGLVAGAGVGDEFAALTVHGPIARDVSDAALFLDAMAGPHTPGAIGAERYTSRFLAAAQRPLLPARVAFSLDLGGAVSDVDSEVGAVCTAAMERLAAAGCEIVEVSPTMVSDGAREAFFTLIGHRAAARYGDIVDGLGDGAGAWIRAEVAAGRAVTLDRLHAAVVERDRLVRSYTDLFTEYDLFVTPVFGSPPWPVPEPRTGLPDAVLARIVAGWPLAWAVTMSGCPAVSLPGGWTSAGHPVGLQLIGAPRGDVGLIRAARAIEQELAVTRPMPLAAVGGGA